MALVYRRGPCSSSARLHLVKGGLAPARVVPWPDDQFSLGALMILCLQSTCTLSVSIVGLGFSRSPVCPNRSAVLVSLWSGVVVSWQ